jgi:NDP-sugar pyrophosphorylase family protein
MNSDLLLKTNFRDLLYFHKEHGKTGTMCTKEYKHKVPYGVVSLEDMTVSGILEKPSYSHLINAGAYCFSPDIFKYFQEKKYVDMTTILQNVMSAGQKICAFPIHEYWMDIGNLDDYQSARQDHT